MEQLNWPFDVSPDTAVITTQYVTRENMPVLYVSHEDDEEGGALWQFHCGNEDYRPEVLQLVRLDEILDIDPELVSASTIPLGSFGQRARPEDEWVIDML